jgi:carboxyl-terminal processing protease
MVVLINGGSASASEIVAGALQEHGIAKLVGEQSYGKGSVQELIEITPDTALKVDNCSLVNSKW